MSEGGGDEGSITCHRAWGQLFIPKELGEEICDQGDRGSKGPVSHPPHQAQKKCHLPA